MQVTASTHHFNTQDNKNNIACIDIDKRIDYALRFSDQAVLVVDENRQQLDDACNRFLITIPEHHNVAFVAISTKFNDIQVRCRIIEQLDRHALFDPEQSLAISLLNMAKESKQALKIVISQAHHLSLQLTYELSQLVALSRKSKLTLSVVMFGSEEAAIAVFDNHKLFKSKIAIFSASTGQLVSKNHLMLQQNKKSSRFIQFHWLLMLIFFVLSLLSGVLWLSQRPNFIFSDDIVKNQSLNQIVEPNIRQETVLKKTKRVSQQLNPFKLVFFQQENEKPKNHNYVTWQPTWQQTDRDDITTSLEQSKVKENKRPLTNENSLQVNEKPVDLGNINKQVTQAIDSKVDQVIAKNADKVIVTDIEEALKEGNLYFSQQTSGYVIQFSAVSSIIAVKQQLTLMQKNEIHLYQRSNQQTRFVITSAIFTNRASAIKALNNLADEIKTMQPWIKSIDQIKTEISD